MNPQCACDIVQCRLQIKSDFLLLFFELLPKIYQNYQIETLRGKWLKKKKNTTEQQNQEIISWLVVGGRMAVINVRKWGEIATNRVFQTITYF